MRLRCVAQSTSRSRCRSDARDGPSVAEMGPLFSPKSARGRWASGRLWPESVGLRPTLVEFGTHLAGFGQHQSKFAHRTNPDKLCLLPGRIWPNLVELCMVSTDVGQTSTEFGLDSDKLSQMSMDFKPSSAKLGASSGKPAPPPKYTSGMLKSARASAAEVCPKLDQCCPNIAKCSSKPTQTWPDFRQSCYIPSKNTR